MISKINGQTSSSILYQNNSTTTKKIQANSTSPSSLESVKSNQTWGECFSYWAYLPVRLLVKVVRAIVYVLTLGHCCNDNKIDPKKILADLKKLDEQLQTDEEGIKHFETFFTKTYPRLKDEVISFFADKPTEAGPNKIKSFYEKNPKKFLAFVRHYVNLTNAM